MNSQHTLIIAEAGVNHNGSLDTAKKLIDVAADAGADFVKFQTFSASRLAAAGLNKASYQKEGSDATESQRQMLSRLELSVDDHKLLIKYCHDRGIRFFSTGFDEESVDMLIGLGINIVKIPSGEITNLPYLRHIGRLKKEVILSTGMACMGEIESAIQALEDNGTSRSSIIVLHCNTGYPTPMEDVNLRAMQTISQAFGVKVGYSDHTQGTEVGIAAVALGARVIEKHFTLDRGMPGPDHRASLEPAELAHMITAIRNVEVALGSSIKRTTPSEEANKSVARKSVVAACSINAGEVLTEENLTVKRAGIGISPMRWDEIVGRVAIRNFNTDELIEI